jgi:hypothetical protein
LPDSLLGNLQSAMDLARPPYQPCVVIRAIVTKLGVTARLAIDTGRDFNAVQAAATSKLADAFGFSNRSFGQPMSASELVAVIQEVDGLTYVLLDSFGDSAESSSLTADPIGAQSAAWSGTAIVPAEVLVLDPAQITLSEVTS